MPAGVPKGGCANSRCGKTSVAFTHFVVLFEFQELICACDCKTILCCLKLKAPAIYLFCCRDAGYTSLWASCHCLCSDLPLPKFRSFSSKRSEVINNRWLKIFLSRLIVAASYVFEFTPYVVTLTDLKLFASSVSASSLKNTCQRCTTPHRMVYSIATSNATKFWELPFKNCRSEGSLVKGIRGAASVTLRRFRQNAALKALAAFSLQKTGSLRIKHKVNAWLKETFFLITFSSEGCLQLSGAFEFGGTTGDRPSSNACSFCHCCKRWCLGNMVTFARFFYKCCGARDSWPAKKGDLIKFFVPCRYLLFTGFAYGYFLACGVQSDQSTAW